MFSRNGCPNSEQLARYLAKQLPARPRGRLERHVAACAVCRRELAGLRQLETLLARVPSPPTPEALTSLTLQRARQTLARPVRRHLLVPQFAAGAVALTALLVFALHSHLPTAPPTGESRYVQVGRDEGGTARPPGRVESRNPLPAGLAVPPMNAPQVARPAARLASRAVRPVRHGASMVARSRTLSQPSVRLVSEPLVPLAAADQALGVASRFARAGDTDLQTAVLENVALAYPQSSQAARALLTAADLHRAGGELHDADAAYRRVAVMTGVPALSRALAYKALGDMRSQAAGNDERAMRHYRQAATVLQEEARRVQRSERAQALATLGEVEETLGHGEKAAAAYAEAAAFGAPSALKDETARRLAQVL